MQLTASFRKSLFLIFCLIRLSVSVLACMSLLSFTCPLHLIRHYHVVSDHFLFAPASIIPETVRLALTQSTLVVLIVKRVASDNCYPALCVCTTTSTSHLVNTANSARLPTAIRRRPSVLLNSMCSIALRFYHC